MNDFIAEQLVDKFDEMLLSFTPGVNLVCIYNGTEVVLHEYVASAREKLKVEIRHKGKKVGWTLKLTTLTSTISISTLFYLNGVTQIRIKRKKGSIHILIRQNRDLTLITIQEV